MSRILGAGGKFKSIYQFLTHHFVLVIDSGASAHQMLHDLEMALARGSLQGRVSGLKTRVMRMSLILFFAASSGYIMLRSRIFLIIDFGSLLQDAFQRREK